MRMSAEVSNFENGVTHVFKSRVRDEVITRGLRPSVITDSQDHVGGLGSAYPRNFELVVYELNIDR
jgi:hypothetical protein